MLVMSSSGMMSRISGLHSVCTSVSSLEFRIGMFGCKATFKSFPALFLIEQGWQPTKSLSAESGGQRIGGCSLDGLHKVVYVNLDVHKDVQAGYCGHVHRHKTGVPIVHQQICFQGACTEVIDAAGAIGHVSQNENMLGVSKPASCAHHMSA